MNVTKQYALRAMLAEGKKNEEIAQLLGVKVAIIEDEIKALGLAESIKSDVEKAGILTKTAQKKNRSVGIMTSQGSQRGDESRKKVTGANRYKKYIHKPKG